MKVAIVGCGLMGLSTARWLAKRGHDVVGFEQFEFGHEMGSSHGASRIVRKAYPDPMYTEILLEAYPMWFDLQSEAGEQMIYECGLTYFGSEDAREISEQIKSLTELGVPFVLRGPGETEFNLVEGEVGVFTPEAGWAHAPTVLSCTRRIAEAHGAKFVQRRIESLDELVGFDQVVVTAGAWVKMFADVPVSVRQATFAYIEGSIESTVFIEAREGQAYGFPNEPGRGVFKVGCHDLMREIDPDDERGGPGEDAMEVIVDFCRRRLKIDEPNVVEAKTCLYTRTEDEHFRIGRMDDRTIIASPCSGHGFKFGPWIGRLLADMAEGKADASRWPCFSL